ncbi:type IV pilus biogenesis protein PilM [Persephonella sp.]
MNISETVLRPFQNLLHREKVSVGIQLDKNFARVAVLEKSGRQFSIPIMPFELSILEDKEESGHLLREELEKRDIRVKNVVVSIPISSTLFKTIKLPKMSPKEIEEAVEWNIREDIKSLKGKTIYDYDIINEDKDMLTVIVVISKIEDIENVQDILGFAGIQADIIDSEGIALLNLAELKKEKDPKLKEESNICIIHLDYNESYLMFFHNNIIVQTLNFDVRRYEEMNPDEKENVVDRLINEINYFFLTINEPKVIYISGLSGKFPEIQAYMQLKFTTRFTLVELEPVSALDIKLEGSTSMSVFNVPFGLAYRRFEDD